MQKPIIGIANVFLLLVLFFGTITPVLAINSTCINLGWSDQTAPSVISDIVPFGDYDDGDVISRFVVEFSGSDTCDIFPTAISTINDNTITNSQPVNLVIDDDNDVNTKSFQDHQCINFQETADKKIAKGQPVPEGLQWNLFICEAGGELLEINAPTIQLTVIVTDSAGNTAISTIAPVFVYGED